MQGALSQTEVLSCYPRCLWCTWHGPSRSAEIRLRISNRIALILPGAVLGPAGNGRGTLGLHSTAPPAAAAGGGPNPAQLLGERRLGWRFKAGDERSVGGSVRLCTSSGAPASQPPVLCVGMASEIFSEGQPRSCTCSETPRRPGIPAIHYV